MKRAWCYFIVVLVATFLFAFSSQGDSGQLAQLQPGQVKPFPVQPKPPPTQRILYSADFDSILANAFRGAYYHANACGGTYKHRKTVVSITNVYFQEEPLGRLHYQFTDGEIDRSAHGSFPGGWRRDKIRACVNYLQTHPWKGFIENGKFKIRMQFKVNSIIKTRAIEEEYHIETLIPYWSDRWDWIDPEADTCIPDYVYVAPCLDVFLTPAVASGKLSYSNVSVAWWWHKDLGFVKLGYFMLSEVERPKITHYKDSQMEILRQRIRNSILDSRVRDVLGNAITSYVKSGGLSNRTIVSVSNQGSQLVVNFQ